MRARLRGVVAGASVAMSASVFGPLSAQTRTPDPRPMGVADLIELTGFGSRPFSEVYDPPSDVDVRSPDGERSAVVTRKSNVVRNTNDYTLLVYRIADLRHGVVRPDTILRWSANSNRSAISSLTWLADSRTIAFLGERSNELPQVYTVRVDTKAVARRSEERTLVWWYGISADGRHVVLVAETAPDTSDYPAYRRHGFAVKPTQFIGYLAAGDWICHGFDCPLQVVVLRQHGPALRMVQPTPRHERCASTTPQLSPDGRYALVACLVAGEPPRWWADYRSPTMRREAEMNPALWRFAQLVLIDVERGSARPLLDTPIGMRDLHSALFSPPVTWQPERGSVVVSQAWLPLLGTDSTERERRRDTPSGVEVALASGRVTILPAAAAAAPVASRKAEPSRGAGIAIVLEKRGLNVPVRLVARDSASGRQVVLLDPGPEVAPFRLSQGRVVRGRLPDGREWMGGFYPPLDAVPGVRYPLVIQTHGFDPDIFAPQGFGPTSNAAQPLAAHGIAVLQIGEPITLDEMSGPTEGALAMATYEAAVGQLDSLGAIDTARVGLVGFSRTCYYVLYTLAHSRHRFAAAIMSDGADGGYFQELILQNYAGWYFDAWHGAPPQGAGLGKWAAHAPGFNLDRVRTPLRLEEVSDYRFAIFQGWEPYARLVALGKPVEMFVIPEGFHALVKPSEQLASAGGAVDWFRFWLAGDEDPAPAKREQYARWRALRAR